MDKIKIDLLKEKYQLDGGKRRPFLFFGRLFLFALIFTAGAGAAFSSQVATSGDAGFGGFRHVSLFSSLRQLVQSGDKQLQGEEHDRVNFLLLGVGGAGHDGPELSDTIIFGSLRPSDKTIGMLSIPRDMTVPIPGEGWRKVNHVNALAEVKEEGSGPAVTAEVLGDLFQQDIHYYIKVDFSGFAELIDKLGGVDIYVDRAFVDDAYPVLGLEDASCGSQITTVTNEEGIVEEVETPIYDCRFEVLSFQEGWAHMDGDTALKYVRSRHGDNGEGSDFARSRRQQKVLMAVKEKVLDVGVLLNPGKIGSIVGTLEDHIDTNLSLWEMARLGNMMRDLDTTKIVNHVLDASGDSPLYATSLNGAYVLLPKNDDWGAIRRMAANVFYPDGGGPTDDIADAPSDPPRFVRIEIQNGTSVGGLAFQTSQLLEGQGFEVVKIGNAVERGYEHTVIYDLTNGQRAEELKMLQDYLKAEISMSASGWLFSTEIIPKEITVTDEPAESKTTEDDIDFLVILGESSANVVMR